MAQEGNDYPCFTCGHPFQMGPHRYGAFIPRYQISVCRTCYEANWDGWSPRHDERLIEYLKASGLPVPKRNAKGWLPRD
jgi:hypothetical protein